MFFSFSPHNSLARAMLRDILAQPGGIDLVEEELRAAKNAPASPEPPSGQAHQLHREAPSFQRDQEWPRDLAPGHAAWRLGKSAGGDPAIVRDVFQPSGVRYARRISVARLRPLLGAVCGAVSVGWSIDMLAVVTIRRPWSRDDAWIDLTVPKLQDRSRVPEIDAAEALARALLIKLRIGSGELDAAIAAVAEVPFWRDTQALAPLAARANDPDFVPVARPGSRRVSRGPQVSSDRLARVGKSIGLDAPRPDPAWLDALASQIADAMKTAIASGEVPSIPLATFRPSDERRGDPHH